VNLGEKLKKQMIEVKNQHPSSNTSPITSEKRKCPVQSFSQKENSFHLYVFVSFSIPESDWLALSNDAVKAGGVLVLRGLPEDSFAQLAVKLYLLRKKGLQATVQIDPRLFTRFDVQCVPCFVIEEDGHFDKLCGNVSLPFALEKMRLRKNTES
jgi:conjugal transfer pilus assembly protein TrbC